MWPPVTVATPHGTGSGLTAGEEDLQKWSPFLSTEAPLLYIFSSSPCLPLLGALMNVGYISFYSFMWLTLWSWLTTYSPSNSSAQKKKRVKENNKSSLYRLLLLSVIREHWSHWQIWGWAIRFHTHCKLDFTAHFKTDEHFLYGHKEA